MGANYTTEEVWTIDFGSEYTNGYQITGAEIEITTQWDLGGEAANLVAGGVVTNDKRPHLQASGGYGDWSDDFEISITLTLGDTISASNEWPAFFQIKGGDSHLRVGPYTAESNVVDMDGSLSKNEEKDASVTAGGTHTITLTKIGTSLSAAVDGVVSSTGTYTGAASGTITDLLVGGGHQGWRINSTVHSISWSKVIPEPTTATLSLLALVGLAARRRRK